MCSSFFFLCSPFPLSGFVVRDRSPLSATPDVNQPKALHRTRPCLFHIAPSTTLAPNRLNQSTRQPQRRKYSTKNTRTHMHFNSYIPASSFTYNIQIPLHTSPPHPNPSQHAPTGLARTGPPHPPPRPSQPPQPGKSPPACERRKGCRARRPTPPHLT